jgi:hypothetical protein
MIFFFQLNAWKYCNFNECKETAFLEELQALRAALVLVLLPSLASMAQGTTSSPAPPITG